jgi:hypothetical protein
MATCQLIKAGDDHYGKLDPAKLLAEALTSLRSQDKADLIAEVDKACEKSGPSASPERQQPPASPPPRPAIPSELRDPFQGPSLTTKGVFPLRRIAQDGGIVTDGEDVGWAGSPDSAQMNRDRGSHLGPGGAIRGKDGAVVAHRDDEVVTARPQGADGAGGKTGGHLCPVVVIACPLLRDDESCHRITRCVVKGGAC